MGKAYHNKTEERKKLILDAALACFTEKGYLDTAIADICETSGASVGSVYHHFGSKEQIAAALYLEGIREYQAGLLGAMESKYDAETGIKSIIKFHLLWVRDNEELARFLFRNRHEPYMEKSEEKLNELNRNFTDRFSRWFAPHIKSGQIRTMEWDLYIALILGPCQEYVRLHLSGKAKSSIKQAVRDLGDAAWLSLSSVSQ